MFNGFTGKMAIQFCKMGSSKPHSRNSSMKNDNWIHVSLLLQ